MHLFPAAQVGRGLFCEDLKNREDLFVLCAGSQRHSSVVRYCRRGFSLAIMFSGISGLGSDRGYSALSVAWWGGWLDRQRHIS